MGKNTPIPSSIFFSSLFRSKFIGKLKNIWFPNKIHIIIPVAKWWKDDIHVCTNVCTLLYFSFYIFLVIVLTNSNIIKVLYIAQCGVQSRVHT